MAAAACMHLPLCFAVFALLDLAVATSGLHGHQRYQLLPYVNARVCLSARLAIVNRSEDHVLQVIAISAASLVPQHFVMH